MTKVILGDALEQLRLLDSESIAAVITDPPYNVGMAEWDSFKTNEEFGNWCGEWAKECFRVLKPGGAILVFSGSRTYHWMACGVERAGFVTRDMLEWVYWASFAKGKNLKPAHEPIYYGVKPPTSALTFNLDDCRVAMNLTQVSAFEELMLPGQPTTPRKDIWSKPTNNVGKEYNSVVGKRKGEWKHSANPPHPGGRVPYNVITDFVLQEATFPTNVMECKKPRGKDAVDHPTQKPLRLMEWLIKLTTNLSDVVLDPFAGSGTTGVAAVNLGRDVVMIERMSEYIDIIKQRMPSTLPLDELD